MASDRYRLRSFIYCIYFLSPVGIVYIYIAVRGNKALWQMYRIVRDTDVFTGIVGDVARIVIGVCPLQVGD